MKLTPTEEELFQRYNPDLQKKSLENRGRREQEFDDFVSTIKEAAKSDKHSTFWRPTRDEAEKLTETLVWISLKEMEDQKKAAAKSQLRQDSEDARERQRQMRLDAGLQPAE